MAAGDYSDQRSENPPTLVDRSVAELARRLPSGTPEGMDEEKWSMLTATSEAN